MCGMDFRRSCFALVLVCSLILPLTSTRASRRVGGAEREAAAQDIFVLVLRSQMEAWIRNGDKNEAEATTESDKAIARRLNFSIFFISIKGNDPSDDFLKRFDDIPRTVKNISIEEPAEGPHIPIDKSSHRAGIVFSVDSIRWRDNSHAEVKSGYYCGGLCAAGITFTVQLSNGKWVIKNSHM